MSRRQLGWIRMLNSDLDELNTVIQHSPKLRAVNIKATDRTGHPGLARGYLFFNAIRNLITVETIDTLILDFFTGFSTLPSNQSVPHLCPTIGTLLGRLRVLHVRMPRVCPEISKISKSTEFSRNLQDVVINLSLMVSSQEITLASQRCGYYLIDGVRTVMPAMREEAKNLISRTASLKLMRILTHSVPQFKIQSFDLLNGIIMELTESMSWMKRANI